MLLKRHRIPKREPIHGDRAFWHWTDLAIGSIADIYSKKYHICSSDEFTRKYLESEGINLDDNVPGTSFINTFFCGFQIYFHPLLLNESFE